MRLTKPKRKIESSGGKFTPAIPALGRWIHKVIWMGGRKDEYKVGGNRSSGFSLRFCRKGIHSEDSERQDLAYLV